MTNLVTMIDETIFTKEQELEFANLQKLTKPDWRVFAEKTEHEVEVLKAKLKYYNAKLAEMEKNAPRGNSKG